MPNRTKNIDLTCSNLPERLLTLREERRLTKADLAARADLSARTIHDLENGRRDRIQEKTLMLLAKALEIPVDELLGKHAESVQNPNTDTRRQELETPPVAASTKRRLSPRAGMGILALLLAVLAMAWSGLWSYSCDNAEWIMGRRSLHAHDRIFGLGIWEISDENHITYCQVSPWRSDRLLVGLGSETPSGGRLLNLDRATGETIWSVGPDIEAIVRAFGEQDVMAANFSFNKLFPIELDGDPATELAVIFSHGRYYPFAVCAIDDNGRLLSQYANKGHLSDIIITDLEGDGRDELIATGTNNAKAYQGGTFFILDNEHWRGASIDSLCDPWSSEPDSAKIRLVIPQYPQVYMNLIQEIRLSVRGLKIQKDAHGEILISAYVGVANGPNMLVYLDDQLRPKSCEPSDFFMKKWISQWPDSLTNGTGPGDPAWRAEWLARHHHFEAGHWPPAED